MNSIVKVERSIIPACDVDRKRYEEIIKETHGISQVGAYNGRARGSILHSLHFVARRL